jgi:hypothetical protein
MKKIKFILLLSLVAILGSCSSDSSSSSTDEYFNFKHDGQTINVTSWEAVRRENQIAVSGYGANGMSISMEFNTNGNIGEVDTYSLTDPSVSLHNAQAYNTNESFTFNLVSVNATNKTVKVTFSGKVYEDGYDLTSSFVNVEGSFLLVYTDIAAEIPGLGVYAKVAGADWYSSHSDQEGGFFSGSDVTISTYNGDQYALNVTTNHDNTVVGSYSFTPSTATNKVTLSKYNTTDDYFEEFDCTGTLNVTSKVVGFQSTVVSGTFSFTAVNPATSAQITVTNGTFTEAYTNY